MRIQTRVSILGAAAVMMAGAAPAVAQGNDVQAFAAEVDSLRRAAGIPGLSIAVVRDGRVVLARGFGWADVEARTPATEHTPYNIASVTKTISGVVALRLAERGKLDLDRPLSSFAGWDEFCTEVAADGPRIFFRDLRCDQPITFRHLMGMRINGDAGQRFFYNPIAFSWASRPMMQVTGRAFSDLVADEVFRPAGMTESARIHRALPLRADLAARLALPYHLDSAGTVIRSEPPAPQGDGAAGGVISTAADLARFDAALDDERLLADSSKQMMWSAGRNAAGQTLPYGVGWYVQEIGARRAVWHSGLWDGAYSALYLKLPDERLTLILLANSDGLGWGNPLDQAAVERSPFAAAFLRRFRGQ
ncbi:serine hydrolase domain-containing protein [Longimicrobium terrae]|uniref:CubicO group peptidase (Beta-lactamase class C family) n=1 Tax=Longimicrobium terrae TaxID=1639882 RepID=A0A841H292_9BACT|nr:serine hydrolase domain-containing protein [Longimicrobium terrae]MBB4637880.1 CubicO group peptidase (beta-lactamase class C family) [Longimicrobium terrae]MBB6072265.1 CubicO group peptidase (beta-lactamase class C family) [Longimicrobium terrae]NNC31187.1 beta-lactamase family protein [Longimicrobium terrae]